MDSDTTAADATAAMSSKQRWILSLASMACFMIALDATIVTTALSTIRKNLGASVETLEWTVNAYALSFAVLLLTGAALGDRFGRRRMFTTGLALFMASSAACALSPNINALISARVAQGAGAALVMPLAMTQITAAFPPRQRGRILGVFSGIVGLATFSGPFVGGVVAQELTWQWLFWINIPIGLAVITGVLARIDETHGPNAHFDVIGVLLAAGGTLGLVWALVRGNNAGWGSPETVTALAAGAVLSGAFVVWESQSPAPMLPMRFFRIRAFTAANSANFCLTATLYGTLFFLSQYFQTALGYGPLAAGARLMPWTGTLMVCAPIAGSLADRLGERRFLVGGLLLHSIGMAWIALIADQNTSYLSILPALIIGGCGVSMAMPSVQKASVAGVRSQEIGQASGAFTMLRQLGGVFGVAATVAVFASFGSYATPKRFSDGFAPAMGVVAGLALVGAIAGLWLPGRDRTSGEVGNHPAAPAVPTLQEVEV